MTKSTSIAHGSLIFTGPATVSLLAVLAATAAAHPEHEHGTTGSSAQKSDVLRIAVQKICPVSGQKLGEHGPPLKIAVGKDKETIFVCCRGCLKGRIDAKAWATIHRNLYRAQGICPVMKRPLPEKPAWTVVRGQLVYVCCPPCREKLMQAPDKYLPVVEAQYRRSLTSAAKAPAASGR